jgi:hypothetical protein
MASMSGSLRPKWWTDFVDEDMGDQVLQGDVAAFGPFVEDRAAVQEHAGWLRLRAEHRAVPQAGAGVEAGELESVLYAEVVQHLVGREVVDPEDHLAGQLAESLGQGGEGALGDRRQVFEGGREPVRNITHRA